MVTYKTGYGFMLTDEFGSFLYEEIGDIVEELGGSYEQEEWAVRCSSVENPQLLLGFYVEVNKNMDFKALDAQWKEHLKNLPPTVKAWLDQYEEFDPNIEIMVGQI